MFDVLVLAPSGQQLKIRLPSASPFNDLRDWLREQVQEEDFARLGGLIDLQTERIFRPDDTIFLSAPAVLLFHRDTSMWHSRCLAYMMKLVTNGVYMFSCHCRSPLEQLHTFYWDQNDKTQKRS